MTQPLRVLIVEDSADDAALLQRALVKGGFTPTCTRVDSEATLEQALEESGWDIIISDHNLPGFSSSEVLEINRRKSIEVPVIIVSGSIGEELAVSAMKAGAQDYIMKDNLARLVPAVRRELREHEMRQQHREAQEAMTYLAYHDSLTSLVNRHEFEQRLETLVQAASAERQYALMFIDLDQFKIINDVCGHVAGDALLRQLATLLKEPIRVDDTLARLGGDEFGVLLTKCTQPQAQDVAQRLLEIIQNFRFSWGDKTFRIGASIGFVMISDGLLSRSELMSAADMACYTAKDMGRNRIHIYTPDDVDLLRRQGDMEWVSRLHRAVQHNEFELHSQRIIPLQGNGSAPSHNEFLIRLVNNDPCARLTLPGGFIGAAERYSMMPQIDRWVVKSVFNHVRGQIERHKAIPTGMHFINVSGTTLNDSDFFNFVREQLAHYAIPPGSICFEVTETAAIVNLSSARILFDKLRDLGCRIALDDFGAGFSSFSYLKSLPADFLKIDGAFIKSMLEDHMSRAIVDTINHIGHVAGMKTIAEFVESEPLIACLRECGVDYAQGYAIDEPSVCISFASK